MQVNLQGQIYEDQAIYAYRLYTEGVIAMSYFLLHYVHHIQQKKDPITKADLKDKAT